MNIDSIGPVVYEWFLGHGWKVILIIVLASAVRRFGMIFLGRVIGRSISHSDRFESDRDRKLRIETVKSLLSSILKMVTWTIVILLILSELRVLNLIAPLLAGAGLVSLLVGFGIQTFIKDFISGIFIVSENQYRVGDYISATTTVGGTVEGTVTRITLRTTMLRDQDGAIHFIPNGNITRAANQTLDYAKVTIELNLPLEADLEKAERAINDLGVEMAQEHEWKTSILQAPYYYGVGLFDNQSLKIEVRAKTIPAQQWHISSELRKRLLQLSNKHTHFTKKKSVSKK